MLSSFTVIIQKMTLAQRSLNVKTKQKNAPLTSRKTEPSLLIVLWSFYACSLSSQVVSWIKESVKLLNVNVRLRHYGRAKHDSEFRG